MLNKKDFEAIGQACQQIGLTSQQAHDLANKISKKRKISGNFDPEVAARSGYTKQENINKNM